MEFAGAFDEYFVPAIDQDVGDGGIAQQRFQRAQSEHFVEQFTLKLLFLRSAERHPVFFEDFLYEPYGRFARAVAADAPQLFQIQLGEKRSMNFCFEISKVESVHDANSPLSFRRGLLKH